MDSNGLVLFFSTSQIFLMAQVTAIAHTQPHSLFHYSFFGHMFVYGTQHCKYKSLIPREQERKKKIFRHILTRSSLYNSQKKKRVFLFFLYTLLCLPYIFKKYLPFFHDPPFVFSSSRGFKQQQTRPTAQQQQQQEQEHPEHFDKKSP